MRSKLPLSNYSEILMGQSPKSDTCNSDGIGFPLLNGPTEFGSRYPLPVQFTSDAKRISQVGDILFCVRGSTTGKMNYADREYAIGRGLASIRGKNGFPTAFVKGLIEQNLQQLLNIATGSTFPNVSKDMINFFEVEEVSVDKAKKIAHILSTLDDKIELNRKMNQTLEEMAQAIFKSWFVNFDPVHAKMACTNEKELQQAAKELGISKEILDLFPNEFEESELGMIPKGWEVVGFKDLVTKYIDNRGKTPPIESEGISLLEVRTLPSDMLVKGHKTDKFVSEETYKTWFRSHLEPDDILISTVGTIGLTCIVPKDSRFTIAQNVLGIRANEKILLKKYMYYMMKSTGFINAINARLVTTVQSSIKRKDMETIDMIIPPLEIQEKFVQIIEPMMFTMQSNQNNTLKQTRDTLLPKLLSGELDVSNINL